MCVVIATLYSRTINLQLHTRCEPLPLPSSQHLITVSLFSVSLDLPFLDIS